VRFVLSLLLLSGIASAQTPSKTEQVIDISGPQSLVKDCGFISRFPGDQMPSNCLQQSTNLLSDRTGVMTRRNGYSQYNLTPCTGSMPIRGLWPFFSTDGSQYLVAFSSASVYYSRGDGTCNAITGLNGGLSMIASMECVQSMGQLWCTDGVDPVFETNVVSTNVVSQAPLGTHIGAFRNRILISGVSGNLTQVYGSGELNGTDFTIPPIQYSTSAFIINVSGTNDGLAVTCLMGEFQNQYLIGRKYDMYGLAGYDNRDFTLRKISGQVGCIEPRSAQEVNNVFYWLSNRGIEGLTGTQITRVSYPIDPTIGLIIAASGNTRSQTITTQGDWQSGNLTASGNNAPVSATISPGDVVPSTFGVVDQSSSSFALGTFTTALTTGPYLNSVVLSSISVPIYNGNFATGDLTYWTCSQVTNPGYLSNYCEYISSPNRAYIGIDNISGDNSTGANAYIDIMDGTASVYRLSYTPASVAPSSQTINLASLGFSTRTLSIKYTVQLSGSQGESGYTAIQSTTFTAVSSITVSGLQDFSSKNMHWSIYTNQIDRYFSLYQSSVTPAVYTSRIFDTGFSTNVGGDFYSNVSSGSGTGLVFQIRASTSPNNDKWGPWVASSTSTPIPLISRYWQYQSTFTTSVGTSTPYMNAVGLQSATTGYYISPCITVSTPTTWGNFTADAVTNGGSLTFWLSTGATCAISTALNANWTQQVPNAQIVVTTGTATIAARILFNMDVGTETPTVNDISFNWNQGAARPPTSSMKWDDRYVLFYTTSTALNAVNDHAVIYDQNQHWQLWDDVFAGSSALYLNQPYIGDSRSTGLIYQLDSGQNDNGSAFTTTFQTADLDGGDPNMLKTFSRVYMLMSSPSGNNSAAGLTCQYSIDGSTLTYPMGSVTLSESAEQNGYFVAKFPVPSTQASTGHWFNLLCSFTGSVGPVSIHRIRIVYTPLTWD
jgi:hypothetical protein